MNKEELLKVIENSNQNGKGGVNLVLVRKHPPHGHKIRTPFGNCTILNLQQKPQGFQTVFRVTHEQLVKFYNRVLIDEKRESKKLIKKINKELKK